VRLTQRQRRELARLAARTSAPHALVQRARMILRLAEGQWPATVGRALGVSDRCVRGIASSRASSGVSIPRYAMSDGSSMYT